MTVPTTVRRGRRPRVAAATTCLAGTASLGIRDALTGPRRVGRVIAVFPSSVYVEITPAATPMVVALVASDGVRLPNSLLLSVPSHQEPFGALREGEGAVVGDGEVFVAGRVRVRTRRWWDPTPVLGPLSPARLAQGARALSELAGRWGLSGHPTPPELAAGCAAADLARSVDAAERIVGLGPGLTPSGDDALAGLLLALRLLGGAVPGGRRAVWLADWLGAAVTAYADERTTSLAATALHCAARGQAAMEVGAVLRGIAGQDPLLPAARRLLGIGHTSGADLMWGLLAGCRAAAALSTAGSRPPEAARRSAERPGRVPVEA